MFPPPSSTASYTSMAFRGGLLTTYEWFKGSRTSQNRWLGRLILRSSFFRTGSEPVVAYDVSENCGRPLYSLQG
jgi:hypothetical protein